MLSAARALLLFAIALLAACAAAATPASTPAEIPVGPAESTLAPTRPAEPTVEPTSVPNPTRTPRLTPTLPAAPDFACLPEDGQRTSAVVAGVIDGDTIRVQAGFQSFVVRYLGIDAPETSVQPPERMGPEATAHNRALVTGNRVTLVGDPEAGDLDMFDRLLRFVIIDDVFVNVELVRAGMARYYPGENACGELIFAAETAAHAARVGIWAPELAP